MYIFKQKNYRFRLPSFVHSDKKTTINIIELNRIHKHADYLLNEHLLCTYIASMVFENLFTKIDLINSKENLNSIKHYFNSVFIPIVINAGYSLTIYDVNDYKSLKDVIKEMQSICDNLNLDVIKYVRKLSFTQEIQSYTGSICGYLDFLFPILKSLKLLTFLPPKTIYLLIDDADNLNYSQTLILNTWFSYRTSYDVSIKISTQLNYKTYRTLSGITIETPHDYSEINISTIYTSSKDKYKERLTAIVERRLKNAKIDVSAFDFFPVDKKQEEEIKKISETIKLTFSKEGRGFREHDDVYRYSRPEYIKQLKARYTFKYAGFEQLVNISSGIIRYFLEPASLMYSEMLANEKSTAIKFITPEIQNSQIREFSEQFFVNEFEKIKYETTSELTEGKENASLNVLDATEKLRNLIESLGGLFHLMLLSDFSERRVFSIALSDKPDKEVLEVLKLGVRYGYLQERTIGNKDGTGRTSMYLLSRRLAPFFTLDPNGFSGYKFITNSDLREAMFRPASFLRKQKNKLGSENNSSQTQIEF